MIATGVLIDNSISMNVDHSFIYLIRDKRIKDIYGNNLMLFIGTVDNLWKFYYYFFIIKDLFIFFRINFYWLNFLFLRIFLFIIWKYKTINLY